MAGCDAGSVETAMEELVADGAGAVSCPTATSGPRALVDGAIVRVIAPALEPVETRGAGDSLTARVAAGSPAAARLADALRLGGAAGALNVTRRGLGSGGAGPDRAARQRVRSRSRRRRRESVGHQRRRGRQPWHPRASPRRRRGRPGDDRGRAELGQQRRGASLTAVERDGRFLIDGGTFEDLAGVAVFAVEAAPAFIVRAAMTGAFGAPPDIVLSGINRGPNTGHAVLHSGTVGAALTASRSGSRRWPCRSTSGAPTSTGTRAGPSAGSRWRGCWTPERRGAQRQRAQLPAA